MMLRDLLEDRRECVRTQAKVLVSGLQKIYEGDDLLDKDVNSLVDIAVRMRSTLPDKSSDLSKIDAVLIPLMELRRGLFLAEPVEEQLEPSELDLLSFGVTREDLDTAASDLKSTHLGEPRGPQPTSGVIYGTKNRILVVRSVQIRNRTLSVTFILDTGRPVTYISSDTARAFGVDPDAQRSNHVRASFGDDAILDVYFFDPTGPHNELNVLGMDYMMTTNCEVKVSGQKRMVTLTL